MNPQISVIIPLYNAERYIDKCIQSIQKQSYAEYEILLIDDGSVDNSSKICDLYSNKFENIRAIHTENKGPAAARKTGVENASGEYVMFLDADDWIDSDMLSFCYQKALAEAADFICVGHKEVSTQEQIKGISSQEYDEISMTETKEMMFHLHGTRFLDSGPWAKLIRRSLFQDIDFCEQVTIGEDYFMVLQLLEKSKKTVLCKEALYNRCIRETSISRSGYSIRHKSAFEQYMKWRLYLLDRYPSLSKEIIGYHTEYEMAVITAMCRNKNYDKQVIKELSADLRKNLFVLLKCKQTPISMRGSAVLIAYCVPLFILIFRVIHVLTGR